MEDKYYWLELYYYKQVKKLNPKHKILTKIFPSNYEAYKQLREAYIEILKQKYEEENKNVRYN